MQSYRRTPPPTRRRRTALSVLTVIGLGVAALTAPAPAATAAYDQLPAFPGAEGFGYAAKGGRGGEVYHVTSRELEGEGTFHDALTTVGDTPRTIVFDISGDLVIPQIIVKNAADITIAGQTAPGDGVTITGNTIRFIDSHDIVIRDMRFRMGAQEDFADDAMYLEDCQNVIIDHSSFSWATDEVLSIKSKDYEHPRSKNITVQWSIMSEGLLTHSMGGLVEMNTITMHHNIYAHNNDRNPKAKGVMDFVNNVVYNWGQYPFVAGGESATKGYGNVVGNYFIAGANSEDPEHAVVRGNENYQVYLDGNLIDSDKDAVRDGIDVGAGLIEAARPAQQVAERFEYPPVHTQSAADAYELTLDNAGASVFRDAVDARVVDEIRTQTGAIIGDETDVGGYPVLEPGTTPTDTDRDGMPDAWERANKLDAADPDDRNGDADGDGYTNLEEYLNELAAPSFPEDYPLAPIEWSGTAFDPPVDSGDGDGSASIPAALNGEVIRGTVVHDNSSAGVANTALWSLQQNLQVGDYVAGDRMSGSKVYRFTELPAELRGQEWIRTAVASRSSTSGDLLSFHLAADADVYVALDHRITTPPAWVSDDFAATGETVADDSGNEWTLYRGSFPAGANVVTGANGATSYMNYFVIAAPTATDTAAPSAAPTEITAQADGTATATVSWQGVAEASRYLISRSSSLDADAKIVGATADTTFADSGVEAGAVYTYTVTAVNAGGASDASAAATVFVKDAAQQPAGTPTHLVATAHSYSVDLSWTSVEGATGYAVYRTAGGDPERVAYTTAPAFTDTTVAPGTAYEYTVNSLSPGGESAASAAANAATGAPLDPASMPAGLASRDDVAFGLTWHAVDTAQEYRVYRQADGDSGFTLVATTTETGYEDPDHSATVAGYTYAVTAANELGESERSASVRIATPVPNAPVDLQVGRQGAGFTGLIWTPQGGASVYRVLRSENGGAPVEVATAKVDTAYDRTAEPDTEYTYVVVATNVAGESQPSASITVRTLPAGWKADTAYGKGDRVSYGDRAFTALWWTKDQTPGAADGAWAEEGRIIQTEAGPVAAWTPTWVYTAGDTVASRGHVWTAKWWTRGDAPGTTASSPWRDGGAY
ncbi:carbohydrate-binding protein [Microbacterium jejuense]|uniref:carbohydrate-binding protein n=1 Tax=Microbacterium jejuense TaxID=1263637 RepID=UPI0031F0F19D